MKKILDIILIICLFFVYAPYITYAQEEPVRITNEAPPPDGSWVPDKAVTIAGKLAARSRDFLNWTFEKYQWACINDNCNGSNTGGNPFGNIYKVVRNIIYAVLSLSILFASFIMIVTRGQEIKATKFIGRFILTVLLVTLIYSLVVFIYQIVDIVVGFFLKYDNRAISSADLLNVGWGYETFKGYKKVGLEFAESAFVSLWLTRITAFTYFVISLILIIRKIVLWFFLIVSPLFPLLLLFKSLKGIYKIWLGEFLRWLFYAPLFAVLLAGVVSIWKLYIPVKLDLNCGVVEDPHYTYPTSTTITLAGPCQNATEKNNLSSRDTFIQYIIALLMLWMVILVPFLLLRMLIEYVSKSFEENNLWRLAIQKGQPIYERYKPSFLPSLPPDLPFKPAPPSPSTGLAKDLPILTHRQDLIKDYREQPLLSRVETTAGTYIGEGKLAGSYIGATTTQKAQVSSANSISSSLNLGTQTSYMTGNQAHAYSDILNLTNLSIPTMVDITRYETAQISGQSQTVEYLNRILESLNRIAGVSQITTSLERQNYAKIKQTLEKEVARQNPMAVSVLAATRPAKIQAFPDTNHIQTVTFQDYEMVKTLWKQNYQKIEPPYQNQKQLSKKEWLKMEKESIEKAIKLITSADPKEVEEGKQMLSKILPFLLLGGFSKEEIIAYLKAKQVAAREVLETLEKQETDQLVEVSPHKRQEQKQLKMEAEIQK